MYSLEEVFSKTEVCLNRSCWWERAWQADGSALQRHGDGKGYGVCRELGIVQGC